MKRLQEAILVLILLPLALPAQREYLDSLFVQANRLYEHQRYAEAANTYNEILSQGYEHPSLYYNAGNAYFKLGRLGEAIWSYEKGLRLRPGDDDLKFNLKIANARIVDRVEAPEPLFLLKGYRALKRGFSPAQWLQMISLFFSVSGIVHFTSRFSPPLLGRMLRRILALGIGMTVISALLFVDLYFEISENEEAVVITTEGRVYSAPADISELLFRVHEGTKVTITGSQYPWTEIELIDGNKGWIRSDRLSEGL